MGFTVAGSIPPYPIVFYDLGYFDDETCRLEPIENPFEPNVLPMSPPESSVTHVTGMDRNRLAGRQGVFPPGSRNINRHRLSRRNPHQANKLAFADSFIRFRPFTSVCCRCQCNDTRNDTRHERLPAFPWMKSPERARKGAQRWNQTQVVVKWAEALRGDVPA
jgi:hypothetical protein